MLLTREAAGFRTSGVYFGPNPPPAWALQWVLRTYAVCTTPLPGQQLVIVGSPSDQATKVANADCPAGKRVVGGGGRVAGGQGQVLLTQVLPEQRSDPILRARGGDRGPRARRQLARVRLRALRQPAGGTGAGLRDEGGARRK